MRDRNEMMRRRREIQTKIGILWRRAGCPLRADWPAWLESEVRPLYAEMDELNFWIDRQPPQGAR